jgi:hypothetical protein
MPLQLVIHEESEYKKLIMFQEREREYEVRQHNKEFC